MIHAVKTSWTRPEKAHEQTCLYPGPRATPQERRGAAKWSNDQGGTQIESPEYNLISKEAARLLLDPVLKTFETEHNGATGR